MVGRVSEEAERGSWAGVGGFGWLFFCFFERDLGLEGRGEESHFLSFFVEAGAS